jgi:hypothetical protein
MFFQCKSYISTLLLACFIVVSPTASVFADEAEASAGAAALDDLKTIPKEERLERAAEALDRMRGTLAIMAKTLDEKRGERDILMLNCINARISAVKGFLKIAEQANVTLQSGGQDEGGELHQLNMIFLADSRVQTLKDEADACSGGETTQYTGPTRTVLKINDDTRQDTTLDSPNFLNDIPLERLPEATPYQ